MPDLLLELFSEEIPARMQTGAARDLERLMVGALTDRGYLFEGIKAFAGPRRLTLAIAGLPAKQKDVREELKGPKLDAPQAALDGFLKKTGLTKDQLKIEKTPKGDVYGGDRAGGARNAPCAGRDHSRRDGQVPLAQEHALEAGLVRALGQAAAFHSLHL